MAAHNKNAVQAKQTDDWGAHMASCRERGGFLPSCMDRAPAGRALDGTVAQRNSTVATATLTNRNVA